ncbi:MAG: hypothetical protein K0B02_02645 [DPANN group archaeon]|nr:hypothetical protein [DPANN group archaeon]
MHTWWTEHFNLLIESKLNKKDLDKVITSENICLRDGSYEFIKTLHTNNIPLIIMSSNGLGGDTISMFLEKEKRLYNNIHIISNTYIWDKDGFAIDIKKTIIHVANKDETSIKDYPVFNKIKARKNVILIEDSLTDVDMVKGFDYDNIIKIGFINDNIEKHLDSYKKTFDVVILNDSDMSYINQLLDYIINNKKVK